MSLLKTVIALIPKFDYLIAFCAVIAVGTEAQAAWGPPSYAPDRSIAVQGCEVREEGDLLAYWCIVVRCDRPGTLAVYIEEGEDNNFDEKTEVRFRSANKEFSAVFSAPENSPLPYDGRAENPQEIIEVLKHQKSLTLLGYHYEKHYNYQGWHPSILLTGARQQIEKVENICNLR